MLTWYVYALLSAVFAALVAILGKKGLTHLDSTLATTLRSIIMTLLLVVISFGFGKFKHLVNVSPQAFFFISLSGIAGALSWLCYFFALQLAASSQVPAVAALDRLSIVMVVLFTFLILGEPITWYSAFGAFLIFIGALLMSLG
jgi:transporter family protein